MHPRPQACSGGESALPLAPPCPRSGAQSHLWDSLSPTQLCPALEAHFKCYLLASSRQIPSPHFTHTETETKRKEAVGANVILQERSRAWTPGSLCGPLPAQEHLLLQEVFATQTPSSETPSAPWVGKSCPAISLPRSFGSLRAGPCPHRPRSQHTVELLQCLLGQSNRLTPGH